MADETRVNNAKERYHDAAIAAITAKQNAIQRYNESKEMELTSETFENWVTSNDPVFINAYQQYTEGKTQYVFALKHSGDDAKADQFSNDWNTLWKGWYYGGFDNGEQKNSPFIIITDEDVDNCKEICEKMAR